MNLPYTPRLLCLCLACFFLVHLALGLLVALSAPAAIRVASRLARRRDASGAARLLLVLRLAPAGLTALLVVGICAPSYLWLEPNAFAEPVGWGCLTAAFFGLTILGISGARGLLACIRSGRYIRQCERSGRITHLRGQPAAVCVVEGEGPLVALTGILRQRLVISRVVMRLLPAGQLAAVLRHERAHQMSRDNFKRLLMLVSPGLLPWVMGFGGLERAWAEATEWAADDDATWGSQRQALALASALISIARLNSSQPLPHHALPDLATSVLGCDGDLEERVDRLLRPRLRSESHQRSLAWVAGLVVAAGPTLAMLQPAALRSVHQVLERLVH